MCLRGDCTELRSTGNFENVLEGLRIRVRVWVRVLVRVGVRVWIRVWVRV